MARPSTILFLDTASPIVSVAVGRNSEVLATRTIALRRSSELLLKTISEVLAQAGLHRHDLEGIAAFQGPGSFTGLRIGLAMAQGLSQGLGKPATALPTLPILAAASAASRQRPGLAEGPVYAAVDAIRGDWMVQPFAPCEAVSILGRLPEPNGEAERLSTTALHARAPACLVGFGVSRLAEEPIPENQSADPIWTNPRIELIEPSPLAPIAASCMHPASIDWDPERLTDPIYFRQPAVTKPQR